MGSPFPLGYSAEVDCYGPAVADPNDVLGFTSVQALGVDRLEGGNMEQGPRRHRRQVAAARFEGLALGASGLRGVAPRGGSG